MKRSSFLGLLVGSVLHAALGAGSQDRGGLDAPPETKCRADFVDGTHQQNPNCTPQTKALSDRCVITLHKIIFPGSQYDNAVGRAAADAELKRAVDYYATYCIDLKVEEIPIPDKEAIKRYSRRYTAWIDGVVQRVGKEKLGKATLNKDERGTFHAIIEGLQSDAQSLRPAGKKLVVVFMDEYIGGSCGHDTLVSSCQEDMLQIGINWVDSGSSHILAHEMIHALGKPGANVTGQFTWKHSSNCDNALSKIPPGRDSRLTIDLSGRLLDVVEYFEIGQNRCAGLLKCHKIT